MTVDKDMVAVSCGDLIEMVEYSCVNYKGLLSKTKAVFDTKPKQVKKRHRSLHSANLDIHVDKA